MTLEATHGSHDVYIVVATIVVHDDQNGLTGGEWPEKSIAKSLHGPVGNAMLQIGSGGLGRLTN